MPPNEHSKSNIASLANVSLILILISFLLAVFNEPSSSLDYLVSVETGTSKVLKAKKYKIPVLSPEEFIAKFTK